MPNEGSITDVLHDLVGLAKELLLPFLLEQKRRREAFLVGTQVTHLLPIRSPLIAFLLWNWPQSCRCLPCWH